MKALWARRMSDPTARVIATGRSKVTGALFNLAVAFEPSAAGGPAIAQSTFHHFADYNWDPGMGAPSFVDEPPGGALAELDGGAPVGRALYPQPGSLAVAGKALRRLPYPVFGLLPAD